MTFDYKFLLMNRKFRLNLGDKMVFRVLLVNGGNGVGKSTVVGELCSGWGEFRQVMSITSREKRGEDDDHVFENKKYIMNLIKDGGVVDWTEVGGELYCTTLDCFDEEKINVYIVDDEGVEKEWGSEFDVLKIRLVGRSWVDDEERIGRVVNWLGDENFDLVLQVREDVGDVAWDLVEFCVDNGWLEISDKFIDEMNRVAGEVSQNFDDNCEI